MQRQVIIVLFESSQYLQISKQQILDKNEVYAHNIVVEIIAKQFFTGTGKADIYTYHALVQQKLIPAPLIALVFTAVS